MLYKKGDWKQSAQADMSRRFSLPWNFQRVEGGHFHIMIYPAVRNNGLHGAIIRRCSNWLIEWCLTPFSTVFQLHRSGQCTYPCFRGALLTSTPHNILSKPLAAFPHCRNNRHQWILSQWLSTILGKNIDRTGDRTSDLMSSSPQLYRLSYGALQLGDVLRGITHCGKAFSALFQEHVLHEIWDFEDLV